jgi:Triose-phosphate Transporter family
MVAPVGPAASPRRVAGAVAFFCASSLGAIFVNKACLTHFRFSFPFFLMLLQVFFTFASISAAGRLSPRRFAPVAVQRVDLPRLAVPTALFVANVSVGLSALTRVNIPMFSAFRRITVLFVMAAEYVVLRKTQSRRVVAAVCALAVGAFISALGDVTFSALGYCLVFANNILTATYLASIKKVMSDLAMTPYSLLYYMSVLSLVPVLVLAVVTGDLANAVQAYHDRPLLNSSPLFAPALLFVAASALCVNLSTSMCTHVTSPLTTSVAGQLKNVLQTVLGFFVRRLRGFCAHVRVCTFIPGFSSLTYQSSSSPLCHVACLLAFLCVAVAFPLSRL